MEDAYFFCNIPPSDFLNHTPAELDMMVRVSKIRMGYEEPREPMTNPEMQTIADAICQAHKYAGAR